MYVVVHLSTYINRDVSYMYILVDGQGMHAAFCSDGDNMCGGAFEHTLSDDKVISDFVNLVIGGGAGGATAEHGDSETSRRDLDARVSIITEGTESFQASSHSMQIDVDDSEPHTAQATSRPVRKGNGKRRKTVGATQKSKKKTMREAGTDDEVCHDFHVSVSR